MRLLPIRWFLVLVLGKMQELSLKPGFILGYISAQPFALPHSALILCLTLLAQPRYPLSIFAFDVVCSGTM